MLVHAGPPAAPDGTTGTLPPQSSMSPSSSSAQTTTRPVPTDAAPPQAKKSKQSLDYILRSGLAGGAAGCAAKTLIAPLDRVKILFQTSNKQFAKYTGSWVGVVRATREIYGQDGAVGLFRGHSMTLLRIFPYAAIKFVAYEQIRAVVIRRKDQETALRRLLCGSMAGVTSVFFTYPLEVARVRMAFDTRKNVKGNVFNIFREIYSERPSAARAAAAQSGMRGGAYATAAAAASASSTAAAESSTAATAAAATTTARKPFFSGIANFYRGFSPTIIGMLPYAGVSFLAHDLMGDWLREQPLAKYAVIPNSGGSSEQLEETTKGGYSRSGRPTLKIWAELAAGGFAGLCSQTASYPLEVIRRRMQVGGAVGTGKFLGMWETAGLIMRERGFKGFYVGLTIGYVKVIPMVATSFFVYERAKLYLGI